MYPSAPSTEFQLAMTVGPSTARDKVGAEISAKRGELKPIVIIGEDHIGRSFLSSSFTI